MKHWLLLQIDHVIGDFLDSCGEDMSTILMRRLDLLSDRGNELRYPISEPIGDGLFQIRGRAGKTRARLI